MVPIKSGHKLLFDPFFAALHIGRRNRAVPSEPDVVHILHLADQLWHDHAPPAVLFPNDPPQDHGNDRAELGENFEAEPLHHETDIADSFLILGKGLPVPFQSLRIQCVPRFEKTISAGREATRALSFSR